MLRLPERTWLELVGHCLDGLPDEACGLLGGRLGAEPTVEVFVPCRNADASSRTYSIGPDGWVAADAALDPAGIEVLGVMHSHTHTDAYPSPTDVSQADNPLLAGWRYVIVSLRHPEPVLRSYLIDGTRVTEEAVGLVRR